MATAYEARRNVFHADTPNNFCNENSWNKMEEKLMRKEATINLLEQISLQKESSKWDGLFQ